MQGQKDMFRWFMAMIYPKPLQQNMLWLFLFVFTEYYLIIYRWDQTHYLPQLLKTWILPKSPEIPLQVKPEPAAVADEIQANFVAVPWRGSLVPGVRFLNLGGVVAQELEVRNAFGQQDGSTC